MLSVISYVCPSNMLPLVVVIIASIMDALVLMCFAMYYLTLYILHKLSKMPTSMTDLLSVLDHLGTLFHIYNGAFLGRELDNSIRGVDIVANSIAFILGNHNHIHVIDMSGNVSHGTNDFSDCKSNDKEASEKDTFYETVVSHILDGVCFVSNDLKIVGMNPAFCSILNKKSEDIIGKYLFDLFEAPPGKGSPLRAFYQ